MARTNTKTDETNHNQKPTYVTYEYRYFIIVTQQHDNKQTAHHHCSTTTNDKRLENETHLDGDVVAARESRQVRHRSSRHGAISVRRIHARHLSRRVVQDQHRPRPSPERHVGRSAVGRAGRLLQRLAILRIRRSVVARLEMQGREGGVGEVGLW